ncbi:MAG TPA: cytochrome D1 domain-containing protein [Candidatus Acidoferrales bacterium]|jgi:YVTN family beta-propeller protein|nr:cytochrome D1 domain-containing protein [Candidatus Acidoferrales bacterium]
MTAKRKAITSLALLTVAGFCVAALPSLAAPKLPKLKVRIIQTNSAGDNVDVIDPNTNKVVGVIDGIEVNHGVTAAPDGSRLYISDEADATLDVIDGKTLKVTKHIALSGHPNNVAITPDGRRVYVAIRDMNGGLDVVDTAKLERIATVHIKGGIHNPYITPDGKFAVAGSIAGKTVNVVDTATNELAWSVDMGAGVRPMAISKNPDGSTKWVFVQLTDLNGFAVIDFASRKEIKRVEHAALPAGEKTVPEGADVSHGIAVTPDQKMLVVNSRLNNSLYTYSLPDLKPIGSVYLGGMGAAWLTLTPDGKTAYIANAVTNDVSAVNLASMKEIARIPVGYVPKRNATVLLP